MRPGRTRPGVLRTGFMRATNVRTRFVHTAVLRATDLLTRFARTTGMPAAVLCPGVWRGGDERAGGTPRGDRAPPIIGCRRRAQEMASDVRISE